MLVVSTRSLVQLCPRSPNNGNGAKLHSAQLMPSSGGPMHDLCLPFSVAGGADDGAERNPGEDDDPLVEEPPAQH